MTDLIIVLATVGCAAAAWWLYAPRIRRPEYLVEIDALISRLAAELQGTVREELLEPLRVRIEMSALHSLERLKKGIRATEAEYMERFRSRFPSRVLPEEPTEIALFEFMRIGGSIMGTTLVTFDIFIAGAATAWVLASLPLVFKVFIGVGFALAMSGASKLLFTVIYAKFEGRDPLGAERLGRWGIGVVAVAFMLTGFWFALLRSTGGDDGIYVWLESTFGWTISLVALWTAALAGLSYATAAIFSWPRASVAKYTEENRLERETLVLLASNGGPTPEARLALPPVLPTGLALLLVGLIFVATLPRDAEAASVPCVLEISVDTTGSIPKEELERGAEAVIAALGEVADTQCLTRVEVIPFSDDGLSARATMAFELPPRPADSGPPTGEISWMRGTISRHEKEREQQLARWREERDEAIGRAAAEIRSFVSALDQRSDTCTSVTGVLHQIARSKRPRLAILLTDGDETCTNEARVPEPMDGSVVVMLITPPEKRSGSMVDYLLATEQEVASIAPWIRIATAGSFDASLLVLPPTAVR